MNFLNIIFLVLCKCLSLCGRVLCYSYLITNASRRAVGRRHPAYPTSFFYSAIIFTISFPLNFSFFSIFAFYLYLLLLPFLSLSLISPAFIFPSPCRNAATERNFMTSSPPCIYLEKCQVQQANADLKRYLHICYLI